MELHPTPCAICGTLDNADELYPGNFDVGALDPVIFSARRLPDRIHYRMARCKACGLVRSDPVADASLLTSLYAASTFDYAELVPDLRQTYGRYLDIMAAYGGERGSLLEVGCGNGFFLLEALERGYQDVRGVEPSTAAVAGADPRLEGKIVCDIMRPGLFPEASFDAVCLFQVFDHLPEPGAVLDECLRVLKPGGVLLCLNHNVEATSARLLKDKSPIIDVEHTYLYSHATLAKIFEKHGFRVRAQGDVRNRYALSYLVRLLPLPGALKNTLLNRLRHTTLGEKRFWVPLGNLYLVAQRPE